MAMAGRIQPLVLGHLEDQDDDNREKNRSRLVGATPTR